MQHARSTTAIARWVMRPTGIAQVALGILFWTGHAYALVPLHMAIGLVFVLSLWALALLAARAGAGARPAALVALWAALVLALGVTQGRILPGSMHWVVKTLHLLVGIGAMELARRLAARARAAGARRASAPPSFRAA